MKATSIFLIVLVFGLSVAPAVNQELKENIAEQTHACCETGEQSDMRNEGSMPCCGDDCNPFMSCCAGMAFIGSGSLLTEEITEKSTTEKFDFFSGEVNSYSTSQFLPPRV